MDVVIQSLIMLMFFKIAVIDWREHAIYDKDIAITALFITLYKVFYAEVFSSLYGCATGLIIGSIIFGAAYKLYGFEAFGQGDVLLLAILGFFLGESFLHYFALSMMLDGSIAAIYLLAQKSKSKPFVDIELPYAPVLLVWLPIYFYLDIPSLFDVYRVLFL